MDGRGRWMVNVFIERLWRSLKYECVYLHAFESGSELRAGLSKWIGYHNAGGRTRPWQAHDGRGRRYGHGGTGGLTITRAKLIPATKLSERTEPTQIEMPPFFRGLHALAVDDAGGRDCTYKDW